LSTSPERKKIKPDAHTKRIFEDGDLIAIQLQTSGKPYTCNHQKEISYDEFHSMDGKNNTHSAYPMLFILDICHYLKLMMFLFGFLMKFVVTGLYGVVLDTCDTIRFRIFGRMALSGRHGFVACVNILYERARHRTARDRRHSRQIVTRHDAQIAWLTARKAAWRFMTAGRRKDRLI
jgi:hypothetical protein